VRYYEIVTITDNLPLPGYSFTIYYDTSSILHNYVFLLWTYRQSFHHNIRGGLPNSKWSCNKPNL